MKNLMKFGLVMAMLFGMAFSAFAANTDFSLRVKNTKGKTVSFSIESAQNVVLSIYGSSEDLLFRETVASGGNTLRQYDLTQFPSGTYTLEAESATEITRYNLSIDGTAARIDEKAKAEVKKPVLVKKGADRVAISIINTEETPVQLTIYDESGLEVFNDTFPATLSTIKMFNFSNVGYGYYTFVTRYSNKTFTESIRTGN